MSTEEERSHVVLTVYRSVQEIKRLPVGTSRTADVKRAYLVTDARGRGILGQKMDKYVREQMALGREVLITPDF